MKMRVFEVFQDDVLKFTLLHEAVLNVPTTYSASSGGKRLAKAVEASRDAQTIRVASVEELIRSLKGLGVEPASYAEGHPTGLAKAAGWLRDEGSVICDHPFYQEFCEVLGLRLTPHLPRWEFPRLYWYAIHFARRPTLIEPQLVSKSIEIWPTC